MVIDLIWVAPFCWVFDWFKVYAFVDEFMIFDSTYLALCLKLNNEVCTLVLFALDFNLASKSFHQVLTYSQSQPNTSLILFLCCIKFAKRCEQFRLVFRWNTNSCISYCYFEKNFDFYKLPRLIFFVVIVDIRLRFATFIWFIF